MLSSGGNSATLAYNATGATLQTAVQAWGGIYAAVTITGTAPGPYTVTFKGTLRDRNVAQLTANASGLTGGTSPSVTPATATQGDTPVDEIAYADISSGGTIANIELLVGQTPPVGALLIDKSDYYG